MFVENNLHINTETAVLRTACKSRALAFQAAGRRAVLARFDGGALTSDGGAVLLHEVERVTGILREFAACCRDGRDPARIRHPVAALVRQRVYGLALGYEDLNDHEQLRHDPLLAVLAEAEDLTAPLAGKSTLNRLALSAATRDARERHKKIAVDHGAVDQLFLDVFVAAHATAPAEVERIVAHLRTVWPAVRIMLRADSGFCRDPLLAWCEAHGVDYVIGLAKNTRLQALIAEDLTAAHAESTATGQAVRRFVELTYQTLERRSSSSCSLLTARARRPCARTSSASIAGRLARYARGLDPAAVDATESRRGSL